MSHFLTIRKHTHTKQSEDIKIVFSNLTPVLPNLERNTILKRAIEKAMRTGNGHKFSTWFLIQCIQLTNTAIEVAAVSLSDFIKYNRKNVLSSVYMLCPMQEIT